MYKKRLIATVLTITLIISIASMFILSVSAESSGSTTDKFVGYSAGISNSSLKAETNSVKNSDGYYTNLVSNDAPQITVLIAGLGGDSGDWTNDFSLTGNSTNYAYNGKSLVGKISKLVNAPVYRIEANFDYNKDEEVNGIKTEGTLKSNGESFKLYKSTTSCSCSVDCSCVFAYNEIVITSITDISNHMIIIFETNPDYASSSNDRIYNELDYAMDKIVYDYKQLNNNVLPRINLIGHSRGGITAMQYALEHPLLVDSLITMGTPFSGSYLGQEIILNGLKMSANPDNEHFTFGTKDVLDPEKYNFYMQEWNNNYDEKYSHINFHAIGSVTSLDGYLETLKNYELPAFFNELINKADQYADFINDNSSFKLYSSEVFFVGDLFVDLNSQLAEGYRGVNAYYRVFQPNDTDYGMISQNTFAIPHNLEAGDAIIHEYILSRLAFGNGRIYTLNSSGGLTVTAINNLSATGEMTIPAEVDGLPVTEIAPFAFSGNTDLKTVYLPPSIEKIGRGAFYGCEELEFVSFGASPALEYIEDEAFFNCASLSNVVLPYNLKSIGERAFAGTSISSVILNASVNYVSPTSFLASQVSLYSVSPDNQYYSSDEAGILYSKDGNTLISYPSAKSDIRFTLPTGVQSIGDYSFAYADNLTSVSLGSLTVIPDYAFYECTDLFNVMAPETLLVGVSALYGTEYLHNMSDYASVGKALIRYVGEEDTLEFYDYYSIAPYSVYSEATSVFLGGEITTICEGAFLGCSNVSEVYLDTSTEVYAENSAFNKSTSFITVYVSSLLLEDYKANSGWNAYNVTTQETVIHFEPCCPDIIPSDLTISFYETIEFLPTPVYEGYKFEGWTYYDESRGINYDVEEGMLWTFPKNEVTLIGNWSIITYSITLDYNEDYCSWTFDEETEFEYNVETSFELPSVYNAYGYIFGGWCDNPDLTGDAVTEIPQGSTGNRYYFARWVPLEFMLSLYDHNGTFLRSELVTFGEPFYFEPPESREGYTFIGWENHQGILTSETGHCFYTWWTEDDSDVTPVYRVESYQVSLKIDDGGIEYLTVEDTVPSLQEGENSIEYGTRFESIEAVLDVIREKYPKEGHKIITYELKDSDGNVIDIDLLCSDNTLNDLGVNGVKLNLVPIYVKEKFSVKFDVNGVVTETDVEYDVDIPYGELSLLGHNFESGVISESLSYVGQYFEFTGKPMVRMADLSPNEENDGYYVYIICNFIPKTVELRYHTMEGNYIESEKVAFGTTEHDFPTYSKKGYEFRGWRNDPEGCGLLMITASDEMINSIWEYDFESISLYADLSIIKYKITYLPAGIVHGNPSEYTVEDSITFTDAVQGNYEFIGWYKGNGLAVSGISVGSTGDLTLTAHFKDIKVSFYGINDSLLQEKYVKNGEIITAPALSSSHIFYNVNTTEQTVIGGSDITIASNLKQIEFRCRERSILECKSGTVYSIYTVNQLSAISSLGETQMRGYTFNLSNSLAINSTWEPIPVFYGTFNGGNYTIAGLTLEVESNKNKAYGLFGINYGIVKNIAFETATIETFLTQDTGEQFIGVAVGKNYGTVSHISVNNVAINSRSTNTFVGGIVGYNEGGVCQNLLNFSATISGAGNVGGIVGYSKNGDIMNCQIYGDSVKILIKNSTTYAGGIVGHAVQTDLSNIHVSNVSFVITLSSSVNTPTLVLAIGFVGGKIQGCSLSSITKSGGSVNYGNLPSGNIRQYICPTATNGLFGYVS